MLEAEEVTREIIGAFYDVYNELGAGFLESVYQNALAMEIARRGLPVLREAPLEVRFRGTLVGHYRVDLLVSDAVLVEVKAVEHLNPAHDAQLINYLRASNRSVGLLLNFGPRAVYRRLVCSRVNQSRVPRVHIGSPLRETDPCPSSL